MMRRIWLVLIVGVVILFAGAMRAQDAPKDSAKAQLEENVGFYKLEFTLREMDGSKVVNKRGYSMTIRVGKSDWEQLRTGTRVPIPQETPNGGKSMTYIDVGVNLDCRGWESTKGLNLQVRTDVSSLPSDAPTNYALGQGPMVRQVKTDSWTTLQSGKSATLFTADEPATARHFEMDVVATKL
jgi:hypothetical protein